MDSIMGKSYKQVVDQFGKRVTKQHDHRHLPRTRCVAKLGGERLEFILPEGVDASSFCRGWKTLDIKEHQVVYPQSQPGMQSVLVNFDVAGVVYVMPEPAPGVE